MKAHVKNASMLGAIESQLRGSVDSPAEKKVRHGGERKFKLKFQDH